MRSSAMRRTCMPARGWRGREWGPTADRGARRCGWTWPNGRAATHGEHQGRSRNTTLIGPLDRPGRRAREWAGEDRRAARGSRRRGRRRRRRAGGARRRDGRCAGDHRDGGDRQVAPARRPGGPGPSRKARSWPGRPPSSSAASRSARSRTRSTTTSRPCRPPARAARRRHAGGGRTRVLAAGRRSDGARAAPEERYRTHRAVRTLLETLAGRAARDRSTTCTGPTPRPSSS